MSNMDYTKFGKSKKNEAVVKPVEVQNGVEEKVDPVIGIVVDCSKLNVRRNPNQNSEVVCEIDAGSEVTICEEESTIEFYKVYTAAGAEGFCMKKYIRTK